jgi:hypothetical protein
MVAFDPDFAVIEEFLSPDQGYLFDCVYRETARTSSGAIRWR